MAPQRWTRSDYGEAERALIDLAGHLEDAIHQQRRLRELAAQADADYHRAFYTATLSLAGSDQKLTADVRKAKAALSAHGSYERWKLAEEQKLAGADLMRGLDAIIRAGQSIASSTRGATSTGGTR